MTSFEAIVASHIQRWMTRNRLNLQVQEERDRAAMPQPIPPSITISFAHGSGADKIIQLVSGELDYQVLDREIVDAICESTPVQRRILESLDRGDRRVVPSMMEQIFNKRFIDDTSYVNTLVRVVRFMSMLGPMIFIGRGACHILRETEALNVRIIGEYSDRVRRISEGEEKRRGDAEKEIDEDDNMRRRFIDNYFGKDIDDPTAYHLVINTSRIAHAVAAEMIADLYRSVVLSGNVAPES